MSWFSKKQEPQREVHVETDAEYWAKRDAERDAWKAQAAADAEVSDDDVWVDRSELKPTAQELADGLFNYELSAYSDKVGYYSDGVQRVSPVRR